MTTTECYLTFVLIIHKYVVSSASIGIVDSSANHPFPSRLCENAIHRLNEPVLFSWFENDQETTAWVETKESDIIYIRSLTESPSPLSRKSRFSWWPLRYSPRKRYQHQQFDLYFVGRSFHSDLPRKFTLNDAQNLDSLILNRLFPDHGGMQHGH